MIYSDLYTNRQAKIPTVFAVILIVVTMGVFTWVFNNKPNYSRASQTKVKRVEVTNVSSVQVTIYWQSNQKETGWVLYGKDKNSLSTIVLDDRDSPSQKNSYLNHVVTLKDLQDNRQFYFEIISGDKLVQNPAGGPFVFSTPSSTSLIQNESINPAYSSSLTYENSRPVVNAAVILTVDSNIQSFFPLLALTKAPDGSFLIPLNSFYNKINLQQQTLTPDQKVSLEIDDETGNVFTVKGTLSQLSMLPALQFKNGGIYVYGQNNQNVLSAQTKVVTPSRTISTVDIIYPEEGALIPGLRPIVKGVALPGAKVNITINSQKVISAVITADRDGLWDYLIPQDLNLGDHSIVIQTIDRSGQLITVKRNFVIIANGNEGKVLGEASSAATPVPTLTVYPTPTSSINRTPTLSPTTPVTGEIGSNVPGYTGASLIILGLGFLLVF